LTNNEDWDNLVQAAGDSSMVGAKLKSENGNGTDDFGFSALLGGYRSTIDGNFRYTGSYGNWWSATEFDATGAWYRGMYSNQTEVSRTDASKGHGFSLRCAQD
jgi:uncharacterized protein (TIGR02145 family)